MKIPDASKQYDSAPAIYAPRIVPPYPTRAQFGFGLLALAGYYRDAAANGNYALAQIYADQFHFLDDYETDVICARHEAGHAAATEAEEKRR